MFEAEQANTEMHELARQLIGRIEKFGTVEGFADSDLNEIIKSTKDILEPLPALVEVTAPIIVFGDIHGQIGDLLQFVASVGRPPERQFLFLGDYVDRASRSLEVITWLFCMKILHPQKIHLLRGNHEVRRVNAVYGFKNEMLRKRNSLMWKAFNDAFAELPLCGSINRKILCMHGGISPKIESWSTLTDMPKGRIHGDCELGLPVDIMWSDPNRVSDDCGPNMKRGISCLYSRSVIDDVCAALDIDMIIRAHEVKVRGHEFEFDKRLLTIFSAPYYSGHSENAGSVACISRSLKLQIVTLKPRIPYETMVADRENREATTKNFAPLNEESQKKVSCKSNFPSIPPPVAPLIGNFSMFAHDPKLCKKEEKPVNVPVKPFSADGEISALGVIRRTMEGYGTSINLKEEAVSLSALRTKLGLPDKGNDKAPTLPPRTPSPDNGSAESPHPPTPPLAN